MQNLANWHESVQTGLSEGKPQPRQETSLPIKVTLYNSGVAARDRDAGSRARYGP
jgi:hypothetical protein